MNTRESTDDKARSGKVRQPRGHRVERLAGACVILLAATVAYGAHEDESASEEQAQGIAHVELAIGQLDGMTQQNAALVEEAAAAAASLKQQTQRLSGTLNEFI